MIPFSSEKRCLSGFVSFLRQGAGMTIWASEQQCLYGLFALFETIRTIRDYSLFAIRDYSLFAVRVFQTPAMHTWVSNQEWLPGLAGRSVSLGASGQQ